MRSISNCILLAIAIACLGGPNIASAFRSSSSGSSGTGIKLGLTSLSYSYTRLRSPAAIDSACVFPEALNLICNYRSFGCTLSNGYNCYSRRHSLRRVVPFDDADTGGVNNNNDGDNNNNADSGSGGRTSGGGSGKYGYNDDEVTVDTPFSLDDPRVAMMMQRIKAKVLADPNYDMLGDDEAIPVINAIFPDGIGLAHTLRALQDGITSALEEVPDFEQKASEQQQKEGGGAAKRLLDEEDGDGSTSTTSTSSATPSSSEAELDAQIAAEEAKLMEQFPELSTKLNN